MPKVHYWNNSHTIPLAPFHFLTHIGDNFCLKIQNSLLPVIWYLLFWKRLMIWPQEDIVLSLKVYICMKGPTCVCTRLIIDFDFRICVCCRQGRSLVMLTRRASSYKTTQHCQQSLFDTQWSNQGVLLKFLSSLQNYILQV